MKPVSLFGQLLVLVLAFSSQLLAHDGHDHESDEPEPHSAQRPERLAEGKVRLSALSQQQLQIQIQHLHRQAVSAQLDLNAHVIADPNGAGRVQSSSTGRLQASDLGLPVVGQTVRRGQVLAQLTPSLTPLEQSSRQAEIAQLSARLMLARTTLKRYQQLSGSIAYKDIAAVKAEIAGLEPAIHSLKTGLTQTEQLIAPIDGVLTRSNAVVGQRVTPDLVLFELQDPRRVLIEAQLYQPELATQLGNARIEALGLDLQSVGIGAGLKDGAQPLLFRSQSPHSGLVPGQSLRISVSQSSRQSGYLLPKTALVRTADGQTAVWFRQSAEQFERLPVKVAPLDDDRVLAAELPSSASVVIRGASLLDQIR